MKGNSFSFTIPIVFLTLVSCEFHSSVHELTKLVAYERFLLRKMDKFITLNENKLDYLKEKLTVFEREREDALEAGDEYFESPINKYLLTKRLSLDWEKLENFLDHEVGTSVLKTIDKFRTNYTFPDENDFNGAIVGMLRLQKIYRLKTKDVAEGILGGVKYSTELSAKDCYDFGKFALKENILLAAQAWLSEALERFENYESSEIAGKLEKADILETLAEVKFKLGDFTGASEHLFALNLIRPNDTALMKTYDLYRLHARTEPSNKVDYEHEPLPLDLDTANDGRAYELTCSEHIYQLPQHERELRCSYLSKTHPFLLLAPIKVEQLEIDPLLLVFHDVIYDSEIKKVIEIANERTERSRVLNGADSVVSSARTSQLVFFPKEHDKVLETIDQRVEDMTGLNMATTEQHQIANYGIGGHYSAHFDFFSGKNANTHLRDGNRIATVLFYLTDVEQGGGTAFPYIKRLVKPKRGAAAFWYNLHASGDGDIFTKHGACPVLVGSKWVLNRWIRERGQEFERPCGLKNDADPNAIMF